ncbi:hypothetical protein LXL04_012873 [Taraxacum kok-saghyz]
MECLYHHKPPQIGNCLLEDFSTKRCRNRGGFNSISQLELLEELKDSKGMKIPCCTVCQTRYNEEDRCPLGLISSASNSDFIDEDEDDEDDALVVVVDRDRRSCGSNVSSSNGLIELGSHQDLRMVRRSCDG